LQFPLAELGKGRLADLGVHVPKELVADCARLCCSLCRLENDPSVIEPDVLTKDMEVASSRIRENSLVFGGGRPPTQSPNSHEFGYSPSKSAT
jgi:hypothetical protein